MMKTTKEYNLQEMTSEQIKKVLEQVEDFPAEYNIPWRERFSKIREYINSNYNNLHPDSITIERLEQIYRNLERWKNQFVDSEELEMAEYVKDVLTSIGRRIEFVKLNPTDPIDQMIVQMVPRINNDIFHHSTIEQWKDLVTGNYNNVQITVNQNAKLKVIMAVIDLIKVKLNLSITDASLEKNEIFTYKGKILTAKQISDNRGQIAPHKLDHYFN